MTWFCMSWTESPRSRARERAGCGEWGVVSLGLISQCNCIFMIFVYFLWPLRESALQDLGLFVFAVSRCTDPKYTSPVTISQRTHTYTHACWDIHCLSRRVCSPRPARPLPAARTHIVSHHRPPHLILPDLAPRVSSFSLRLFRTFPSTCCLFGSLLSVYESLYLFLCVSIYWSIYLHISSPFPFISGLFPPGRKGWKKKEQLQLRARSQNLLHLDFITNEPAHCRRITIKGGKMKEKEGSKACNIVNKFKLSTGRKASGIVIYYFCVPNLNVNQLLLSQSTLTETDLMS